MKNLNVCESTVNVLYRTIDNLSDSYKSLLEERKASIVNACKIVERLNDDIFNISNVQFKTPIKVQYVCDLLNLSIEECEVTCIYNCGFEYTVECDDFEINIEDLTSDSLEKVLKAMEDGMWDVCLLDSDEEFHLISREEFWKISKIEHEKRYNQHCEEIEEI